MSAISIVALGGTMRAGSSSENAARVALAEASKLGAMVQMFDGALLNMPMYAPETSERTKEARSLVKALRSADGIILASPGYHGGISGLLKNALDYTEDMREDTRVYLEHRSVGCIVCAAGWQAVGTTLTSLRSIVHALRGWPTPLGVGINTVAMKAFDKDGNCTDPQVEAQLRMLAEQVVNFAQFGRTMGHRGIVAA